jgi:hypothetical protein
MRKKIQFAVLCFLLIAGNAAAQSTADSAARLLKVNLPALLFGNLSMQYEQAAGSGRSWAVAVRFRPKAQIPMRALVKQMVEDTLVRVDEARIGNFGIIPEYRFYLGRKGALRGFYLSPMVAYNYYYGNLPVKYYDYVNNTIIDKSALFNGHVHTLTAGLQVGAQWKLGGKWYLDWWIIGPNFGLGKGRFDFAGTLNDIEQISLQFELEKIKQTTPLIGMDLVPGRPDDAGAAFTINGPWAGIRAMGISLALRL